MQEQKPWLKNYPIGRPVHINPDQYTALKDFADETFKKFASKEAFVFMGKSITYQELDQKSRDFGAYLHSRGLKPGDRIALMMPNLLQYPIAIFGALRAGMILVNTNPMYTSHEMEYQFKDSGAKAIIIAENFAYNLEKIIANTNIEIVITTTIGEMLGFKGVIVDFIIKYIKRVVPKFSISNCVSFSEALNQGKKFQINAFESQSSDVILLQYTGGTTGVSKGAMLTNRNLVANLLQIKAAIGSHLEEGKETALSPLPMYHIFAFAVNVLAMMSLGANTVLIVNAKDIKSVAKAFEEYPISLMTGVNTLFNALLNYPGFEKNNFKSLKVTVGGGMAVQNVIAEKWQATTGCYLAEGFGMTETSPVVSINALDASTGRIGYIGMPVSSTDVRIVDESGRVCGFNEPGEIQVMGPQVMKGYYNKPAETEKAFMDGWLCTGDIGIMEPDGFLKIVDRKKDMILVSGFNVYPNEIEDVIAKHPKVLEVAVIGVPDAKSGEVPKVFIVKKDKNLTESEILDYCKEYLTNYKLPRSVEFRESLPKTNVGKILRRELRNKT